MRKNISNNKRHIVVAEEVRDRCVETIAAAATLRNADVANVQCLFGSCIGPRSASTHF